MANWGDIEDAGCVEPGRRKYFSRLWNISGSWEAACWATPGPAGTPVEGRMPDNCINKHALGMWGEWFIDDPSCVASWGALKDDGCSGVRKHKYSAVIQNVPPGQDWENACRTTPGPEGTATAGRLPDNCVRALTGEWWGEWFIDDPWCGTINPDFVILRNNIPGVDGWVSVRLGKDGTVTFSGHVHNSRIERFAFQVGVAVSGGTAIGMAYRGSVGGFGGNHDWDQTFTHPNVSLAFPSFLGASLNIQAEVRGDITGFLEDIGKFLVGWLIGSVILQPAVAIVIVLGVEVGSLITTGGFVAGAKLVGGTLWLLGPSGTVVALAAEGVAVLGSQEREISQMEYDYANEEVFKGTLPPRERIVLTDTLGGNGSYFVFPRFDGKITVNIGPHFYADPLSTSNGVVIHELTHTWQLQNTLSEAAFIAQAAACRLVRDPYGIPDPLPPFAELNMEQQAALVQKWFNLSPPNRLTHAYNQYIEENIRTGHG